MDQKTIEQVFEQIGIEKEEYPPYTDPYTFSKQIKKFSLLQVDQICYGNSTVKLEGVTVA